MLIQSSFVSKTGSDGDPLPKSRRKIKLQMPAKTTVQAYKSLLTDQLTALASARPDEEIELDVETL